MSVVYKLWRAVGKTTPLRATAKPGCSRPDKVHRVVSRGYSVLTPSISANLSPQRTPFLFRPARRRRVALCSATRRRRVLTGPSRKVIAPRVADIRERARNYGRNPDDILIFLGVCIIVDRTEAAAREKERDYRRYVSTEGALALLSGWSGIDFSKYASGRSDPLWEEQRHSLDGGGSLPSPIRRRHGPFANSRMRPPSAARDNLLVGSAEQVADELQSLARIPEWTASTCHTR